MKPRVKNILKWCGAIGSTSLIAWTIYESIETYRVLRKPLSTNCCNKKVEWVYVKHNYLREPFRDFLNEFFREETKIYSFLYNLKKKLTFTKVSMEFV